MNDLLCDLGLSRESSEILASRFGEHGILDLGIKITFHRDGDDLLIRFFTMENGFVYCNNIQGLPSEMGPPECNPDVCRLLINSSKQRLKCVLLHNGNKFACVPIGHSVIVEEHNLNVKMVLQKLCYSEHNWAICVDFKMVIFFLNSKGVRQGSLFSLLLGQCCCCCCDYRTSSSGWRYGTNGNSGSCRQPNWNPAREKMAAHFEPVMSNWYPNYQQDGLPLVGTQESPFTTC